MQGILKPFQICLVIGCDFKLLISYVLVVESLFGLCYDHPLFNCFSVSRCPRLCEFPCGSNWLAGLAPRMATFVDGKEVLQRL